MTNLPPGQTPPSREPPIWQAATAPTGPIPVVTTPQGFAANHSQGQPSQPSQHGQPLNPPPIRYPLRRHRGIFWVAVLAAMAALAGGVFVAMSSYTGAASPGAITKSYFHALDRGDAAAALALGDVPAGPRTYLTADALREALQVARITNLGVLSVDQDGATARVAVQYLLNFALGAAPVNDVVELKRQGHRWRLAETAVATSIRTSAAGHRLTMLGAPVPSQRMLFFPGALPVRADTPNLDTGDPVVHFNSLTPITLSPVVSAAGQKAIAAAVASAARPCLDARAVAPCPALNDDRAVPGTLHAKLPRDLAGKLKFTVAHDPDGRVDATGTVDVAGSYQRLDFDNLPVAKTGRVPLDIHVHCYVTDPGKLVWDTA